MRNFNKTAIFFFVVKTAFAGGWPQEKGKGYYKFDSQVLIADHYYLNDGSRQKITTIGNYTFSVYGEYGVTDIITAGAYVPFLKHIALNRVKGKTTGTIYGSGGTQSYIADAEIFMRTRIVQLGQAVISGSLLLGVPIGDHKEKNGLVTGDGEWNKQISMESGYSFYPIPLYATGNFGINYRTKGYSDELRYGMELGYTFVKKVTFISRLRGIESIQKGNQISAAGDLVANDQEFLSYGFETDYQITPSWGLAFNFDSAFFGKNILSAPAFSLGVYITK